MLLDGRQPTLLCCLLADHQHDVRLTNSLRRAGRLQDAYVGIVANTSKHSKVH